MAPWEIRLTVDGKVVWAGRRDQILMQHRHCAECGDVILPKTEAFAEYHDHRKADR